MNRYERVDELYAQLPDLKCKRKCQQACGPILMSKLEWGRITEFLGYEPAPREDLTCPMLSMMGNCTVYKVRPAICRLYGMVRMMQCPHGCVPERWVENSEARELLFKLLDLE